MPRYFKKRKKKKVYNEENVRLRVPKEKEGEMFALALQRMGGDQIKALCADGTERSVRIPGKMRRRVWIREGDVIIIKIWDFQPSKADVVWRYFGFQTERLKRQGLLKDLPV